MSCCATSPSSNSKAQVTGDTLPGGIGRKVISQGKAQIRWKLLPADQMRQAEGLEHPAEGQRVLNIPHLMLDEVPDWAFKGK